jgi:hypothetical protein
MTYEAHRIHPGCQKDMWHSMDLIRGCFDNPEGLNYVYMPSWRGSRVRDLANELRLGTVVPSQDLIGV